MQADAARAQAKFRKHSIHRLRFMADIMKASHKKQIFPDRQVPPHGELLAHIADTFFYFVTLPENIFAQAITRAGVRSNKPAHHAYRGCLTTAIRTKKPMDLPFMNMQ